MTDKRIKIYESQWTTLKKLPDNQRLKALDAVLNYGLYGEISDFSDDLLVDLVVTPIIRAIDRANECAERGRKGGIAKANKSLAISPANGKSVPELITNNKELITDNLEVVVDTNETTNTSAVSASILGEKETATTAGSEVLKDISAQPAPIAIASSEDFEVPEWLLKLKDKDIELYNKELKLEMEKKLNYQKVVEAEQKEKENKQLKNEYQNKHPEIAYEVYPHISMSKNDIDVLNKEFGSNVVDCTLAWASVNYETENFKMSPTANGFRKYAQYVGTHSKYPKQYSKEPCKARI